MKQGKKRQSLIKAFNCAIDGIIYTFKHERNMKIHYLVAALILIASLFFDFSKQEMLLLLFAVSLVVISEMFNTAIEKAVDIITDEYHPLAKISKDVAAGAVLIASLNSVVVGYILFFDKIDDLSHSLFFTIRKSELHVTVICIVMVLIAVVVVKSLTSTGTPLQGGMPSGHAAVAFALATAMTFISENMFIATLSLFLALLVCQSRIEGKIHTFYEVIAGAIIGGLISIIFFQIFG